MWLLISGLCVWVAVHSFPAVAVEQRARLVRNLGTGPYKGLFALGILISIILIVLGWRSTEPVFLYQLPAATRHLTYLLVLITFVLFVAARTRNSIKRYLRHPQLTGVVLWSIGHLLVNGDSRSLVLFGVLGLWAILEMVMINRREGVRVKPEPVAVTKNLAVIIAGMVLFAVLLLLHPWIAGVRLIPA